MFHIWNDEPMRIDLNALLLFYEVVNAQSITRAARNLGLPKSTVSRKVRHLEDQLGTVLLKNSNRRIVVTDAGQDLHEHCSRIAAEVDVAGLHATRMQTELGGKLRVSMPIDFGIGWLGSAIASFAAAFPAVRLDINVSSRWVDVSEESFDVAIHFGRVPNTGLPARKLSTITRGFYASAHYIARRGLPTRIEDLESHDCVTTEQQITEGIWVFQPPSRQQPVAPLARLTVNNIGVARELVIGGIGLGILPNVMCRNDVKINRLVRVLTNFPVPSLEASATYFAKRHPPRRTTVFLDHMAGFLQSEAVRDAPKA